MDIWEFMKIEQNINRKYEIIDDKMSFSKICLEEDPVKEITFSFGEIKSSIDTIDWLRSRFPQTDTREKLISYLSLKDVVLEDKFYHKEKPFVIFYFQVYNRKSKKSHSKRISLRTSPDE
jgi:hypothetical protein